MVNSCAMILGDNNFFMVQEMRKQLQEAAQATSGATVFGYHVEDPERFGVVEFDENGLVKSIEEKPKHPNQIMPLQGYIFMIKTFVNWLKR